jgi:preprotein translocase subunit SecA
MSARDAGPPAAFRERLKNGETLDAAARAFAAVREAAKRTLGQRPST